MTAGNGQNSGFNGRQNNLDEALNRCLRAVESGQISVEECIARFPQFPELGDLLRTAVLLSDLPRPPMPTAVTMRTQRRLQTHLRERVRATRRGQSSAWRVSLGRLALMMGIVVLVLFAGGAALVRASASAVPGDPLFTIKRSAERVNVALTNGSARSALLVTLAQTRIQEINTLAGRGQAVKAAWIEDMYGSISQALAAEPDQSKREQLTSQLTSAADGVIRVAQDKALISPDVANAMLTRLQQLPELSSSGTPNLPETATPGSAIIAVAPTSTATSTETSTSTSSPTATIPTSTPTDTATFTATVTHTSSPTQAQSTAKGTHFTLTFTATALSTSNKPALPTFTPTLGPGPARVLTGIPTSQTTGPATQEISGTTSVGTQAPTNTETSTGSTQAATLPATDQSTQSTAMFTPAVTDTATWTPTSTPSPTLTSTPSPTSTKIPTRTPKPPTATPVPPTATPTQTNSPVPTPNGLPSQDLKQPWQEITFHDCKPEGDGGDAILNQTRNRVDEGKYQQTAFDSIAQLPWPKDAEGKSHDQWSQATKDEIARFEGLPVLVEATLIKAQANGPEAQNCHSSDFVTWQLWLSGTPGQNDLAKAMVVGVSPRIVANHAGWTLDKLNALAAAGAKVRISGWLSFNPEQAGQVGSARVSLWEIHPAMQIAVSQGDQWINLDDYQP